MRGPGELGNPGEDTEENLDLQTGDARGEPRVSRDPALIPSSGRDLDPCGYWQDLQVSQAFPRAPRREASRDTKGYQTKKGRGDAEEMWGGPETALPHLRKSQGGPCL